MADYRGLAWTWTVRILLALLVIGTALELLGYLVDALR